MREVGWDVVSVSDVGDVVVADVLVVADVVVADVLVVADVVGDGVVSIIFCSKDSLDSLGELERIGGQDWLQ